jgi:hypothetical protein
MTSSQAHALARGGAVLTVASLVTPWYVLRAGPLSGEGKSGAQALGSLALVVVALGVAAGWSRVARAQRQVPIVAASALTVVVVVKFVSAPQGASAFPGPTAAGDAVTAKFTSAFADAVSTAVHLHYAPTWGLWLAAVGAGLALAGTITRARLTSA